MSQARPHHQRAQRGFGAADEVAFARAEDEAALPREVAAEREVARIAARQYGVVTTDQLAAAGLSGTQLTRRVAGGWLVRRHVGIYRLGVFGGPFEEEMAALLACGPRSALGRWSSIAVYGLGPRPSQVHVVFDGNRGGRRAGVRAYRTSLLPASDVVVRHGLRVTTPARTLLDLAAEAPRDTLERLIEEVQVQGLATTAELLAVAARGAGKARRVHLPRARRLPRRAVVHPV